MKVYYYCPDNGVYQGEGFLDEKDLDDVEGVTAVAPPGYAKGEAPYFLVSCQRWAVRKVESRQARNEHDG